MVLLVVTVGVVVVVVACCPKYQALTVETEPLAVQTPAPDP
jgi:hypothetical protein